MKTTKVLSMNIHTIAGRVIRLQTSVPWWQSNALVDRSPLLGLSIPHRISGLRNLSTLQAS